MWPLSRRPLEQEVAEPRVAAVREAPAPARDEAAPPDGATVALPPSSAEEILRRVLEGAGADTGRDFLRSLVRHLAGALGMRWAFVGELLRAQEAGGGEDGTAKGAANGDGNGDGNGNGHEPAPGGEQVRVLAFWDERPGEFAPNLDYALVGTPCEEVVGRAFCEYRSGVAGRFPRDPVLARI